MFQFRLVEDPPPEAWNRVQRYASWMHELSVDGQLTLGEDVVQKLRLNLPAGGWFPALEVSSWTATESNLPYVDLFLSLHLKRISIYMSPSRDTRGISYGVLLAIVATISALPTSALQDLLVEPGRNETPRVDSRTRSPPSLCVADHRSRDFPPQFNHPTRRSTVWFTSPTSAPGMSQVPRLATLLHPCP